MPPCKPQWKNFCTRDEYFTMANGFFNFNFLALVFSEILGGFKFTLGGSTPPGRPLSENFLGGHTPLGRPLAEKYFYPKRVLYNM